VASVLHKFVTYFLLIPVVMKIGKAMLKVENGKTCSSYGVTEGH